MVPTTGSPESDATALKSSNPTAPNISDYEEYELGDIEGRYLEVCKVRTAAL